MHFLELDTPSLLIDEEILLDNLQWMQSFARRQGTALRPHTKTHKMPYLAQLQLAQGACGIAVAKVGEAEAFAAAGLGDIFIANEIVGRQKLQRIAALAKTISISYGVDAPEPVEEAEAVFAAAGVQVPVLIEIEVGENRSGIVEEGDFLHLLDTLGSCRHVRFQGLFSHDGNSYRAPDQAACRAIAVEAQRRTLHFAALAADRGMACQVVSYGSTPTLLLEAEVLPGITELRLGTYALMDESQANATDLHRRCAATVLATVMSKPTDSRVILDVGAKGLTMQQRTEGICATAGKGRLLEYPATHIHSVYDEHAIVYDRAFHDAVRLGDKVRIVPAHICPVCNLYDTAYLLRDGQVVRELEIAARGRLR